MAEAGSSPSANAGLCGQMRLGLLKRGLITARRERVNGAAWAELGVADPFEDVESEFAHLVDDAISPLDGCAMECDPEKEQAAALSLEATVEKL